MNWRSLPNAICVARMVLVVPSVVWVLQGRYLAALAVFVVAGLSDGLDGFLAKRFGWQTRLGSLLDPAADKLLLVSMFVTLSFVGHIPPMLTAIVVARDVIIVAGAIAYQLLIAPVRGEPALASKLNTACQLAMLFFTLIHVSLGWPPRIAVTILGAIVIVSSLVSGLDYILRWSERAWRMVHAAAEGER